jgi:glyoxylase-like metal-dependent hydrolase (beta-lactamase superfamily II)
MKKTHAMFRAVLAAVLIASAGLCSIHVENAYAAAPMVKTQAPGYYRVMLGNFEVTALSDGTITLPVDKLLMNTTPAKVDKTLARSYESSPLQTSVNAFLINTGSKLVLIDTGAAGLFGPTLGNLLANLKASGYEPEQIDEIYITHMHGDHVGGLMADGKMAFPNAIVRADKRDADYWLSQQNMDKAPDSAKDGFKNAMVSLNPYVKAGHFKPFSGDTELAPGIKAISTYGHTPGHTSYRVDSNGKTLIVMGDLIHVAAVQFGEPSLTMQFDSDRKSAAAQRKRIFNEAARNGYLVAGAHLSFPGLGHIRASGNGYVWIPVNYEMIR